MAEGVDSTRKPMTTVYMATNLDGFIARPDGAIDWLGEPDDDDDEDYGWAEFISGIDAIVTAVSTCRSQVPSSSWTVKRHRSTPAHRPSRSPDGLGEWSRSSMT